LFPAGHRAGEVGTNMFGLIALRTTVQGGIQEIMGGSFRDGGAIAGFASGLAEMTTASLNANIDAAVTDDAMTALEDAAAKQFVRVLGSAIRAAANPDDPQYAFASAYLDSVLQQVGTPAAPAAFDDDGNLMPNIVDWRLPPDEQQSALRNYLEGQGFDVTQAAQMADDYFASGGTVPVVVTPPPAAAAPVPAPVDEPSAPPAPVAATPAFDDEGNLMPGAVDTSLPPDQQAAQLQAQLRAQGLSAEEAALLAYQAVWPEPQQSLQPPSAESQTWTPEELQPRIDEVERRLQAELQAQQAREDSLLDGDDLSTDAGGPGNTAPPIRPVLNRGFDATLNAASDLAGLLGPLQALQGDLATLQSLQAEARLSEMRQAMRNAGMSNVSDGYVPSWDANGNLVRDYRATADQLSRDYEGFVRDQRLRANWGDNYQSLRIGNSQMTVQEFETRTLQLQQTAANEAYERGVRAIAAGQLPLTNGNYVLTLANYVDQQSRLDLRRFGVAEGIPDSNASNIFAVNRYIRGSNMIGIPDLRIGAGLLSDVSLARKDGYTDQLRRWNVILPNDTLIIRPDQLGGSYVVPRGSIRPLAPRRGG
jgi:hypothetical protein